MHQPSLLDKGEFMEPIFNRNGRVVAWINENNICHLNGRHAAVLNGTNVYGQRGQHLGVFENGLFRDHRGGVVAFIRGGAGGRPVLPVPNVPPVPPVPSVPPVPAVPVCTSSSSSTIFGLGCCLGTVYKCLTP